MKYYSTLIIGCFLFAGCDKTMEEGLYLLEDLPPCEVPGESNSIAPDYYIVELEFNPNNANQIIYVKWDSKVNLHEIRLVDLEKGTDLRLFSDSKKIFWLDWSVKNKILFARDSFIYTMNVDGSHVESIGFPYMPVLSPVSYYQYQAVWSPDGNKALTSYSEGGQYHIQIKNINNDELFDTIPPLSLPNNCLWYAENYAGLFFNTNSQTIQALNLQSFMLENIGTYSEFPGRFDYHHASGNIVYIPWPLFEGPKPVKSYNIQTGQSVQLSSTCPNRDYRFVKISTDGKRVAATCYYVEKIGGKCIKKESIFVMDADGKNERRITIVE